MKHEERRPSERDRKAKKTGESRGPLVNKNLSSSSSSGARHLASDLQLMATPGSSFPFSPASANEIHTHGPVNAR